MIKYVFAILFLSGCATTQTECPSVEEVPVSTCRADKECGGDNKFLRGLSVFLGGLGRDGGPNNAKSSVEQCFDNNMAAQRSNAGISSTQYKCQTVEVYQGKYETKCTPY